MTRERIHGKAALLARLTRGADQAQAEAHRGVLSGTGETDPLFAGGRCQAFRESVGMVQTFLQPVGWVSKCGSFVRTSSMSAHDIERYTNDEWQPVYSVAVFEDGYA